MAIVGPQEEKRAVWGPMGFFSNNNPLIRTAEMSLEKQ